MRPVLASLLTAFALVSSTARAEERLICVYDPMGTSGPAFTNAKAMVVDDWLASVGSANMDIRSFRLNFEILLAVYDPPFTRELRALQQQYIDGSELMDLAAYRDRPALQHGVESFARLFGPLL